MGGRSEQSAERITGVAWVVGLCGDGTTGCHGAVEGERALARTYGWLIEEGEDASKPLAMQGMWGVLSGIGTVEWMPTAWDLPDPVVWMAVAGGRRRR